MGNMKTKSRKELEEIFKSIDTDNNGYIDKKELIDRFKFDEKEAKKIWAKYDKDRDGKMSLDEFIKFIGDILDEEDIVKAGN